MTSHLPDPAVVEAARTARRVVVFSGAGMSAESGIPTFRDAQTGLWERFSPEQLASPEGWERDRGLVWAWYQWRTGLVRRVHPNEGHLALAAWARHVPLTIVTQNVDDLHERAGSEVGVHLHGSLFAPRCSGCEAPFPSDGGLDAEPTGPLTPPACPVCGAPVRPGAVWFGEALPQDAWERAEKAVAECDLMVVVGTSGVVHPAAMLPLRAVDGGATVVEINPQATELSPHVHHSWRTTAAGGLPALAEALGIAL
ncbi:SIR2 family NAD-dependent protein deacylase [Rhodococcus sp. SGAir0479]|uniref:SIR2 family NAD-dependent protein deacylase n=1 Tax=Rhodococcus sp. SGAir0479 TaxID=2567884 RepID=UPI0010CCCB24|nr:NAD-dependent deacylase [Rhodococcus sp. SGAir0479]QCQ90401.1 NAD-dependent deacylase [Rhodococcus sp. SGAir0479]